MFNRFGNMMPPEEANERPYLIDRAPFIILGNLYYVGNQWCSSHLIDTGDGLLLLDTPTASGLPGLIHNIHRLNFKLEDLKYIVVSHAHSDHFGAVAALQHMTGAKTFISRVDAEDMRNNPERMIAMNRDLGPFNECFTPDRELEDGDIIELGNTRIRCVLTPGHTIGVMSHFWTMNNKGTDYTVGIYGGAGYSTVSEEWLKNAGLPLSLREEFKTSIEKVWNEPVDIMLGNHPFHNDTYLKSRQKEDGDEMAFVNPSEWRNFLTELKTGYQKFLTTPPIELKSQNSVSQWNQYYKN